MTTPSAQAAVAASSAAPASQAPGGTRPAVRRNLHPPPAPLPRPGARWALPACSRRGFPAGWRFSTGPPAPSIARGPRRSDRGEADPILPLPRARPLRRSPRRAGPRARWARGEACRVSQAGDVASFQALPGVLRSVLGGCSAVLRGGWSRESLVPRTPARHHGCGRALAADPAALASDVAAHRYGPHLAISGPSSLLPCKTSASWGEPVLGVLVGLTCV